MLGTWSASAAVLKRVQVVRVKVVRVTGVRGKVVRVKVVRVKVVRVSGEGEGGEGEGGEGEGGEGEGGEGEGGEGEGGEGEGGEGEGGEGGGGGDVHPVDIFKVYGISAPRSFSGVVSPPGGEVDRHAVAAAWPLLLAITAALWLACVAVMAAFTRFIDKGLALSVRARSRVGGGSGGEVNGTVAIFAATPDVIVAGVDGGEGEGDEGKGGEGEGGEGEGDEGEGGEGEGGEGEGGEGEVGEGEGCEGEGGEGEGLSSASPLLSSLRLALLARSRLLLPEWCAWAWVAASPAAVGRNQRETSSVLPSVSNTNLAGNPSLLQRIHAMYWLCALGGEREPV